jgi:Pyruvate/2-oxoacid:ferredoxin oxidoreductase gamma subunit
LGDALGSSKVGNMVMLGALLEAAGLLEPEPVQSALRRLVKADKWFELDLAAIECGREEVRKSGDAFAPAGDDYLWGV